MNNQFYTYALCYPNNVPFYIGKGKENRANRHLKNINKRDKDTIKRRIINKIQSSGEEVLVRMLSSGVSEEEALEYEIELIKFYGRRDNGTGVLANLTDGGEGTSGQKHSKETKRKMSEARKGENLSLETRKRMSEAGKVKVFSEEHRRNMSESSKGKKHSEETKRKLSNINKGRKHSEETKRKISEALTSSNDRHK